MTVAYLTEQEITRKLCLPDKIGRLAMATWKMQPSFPKPAEGMGGRRFWPEIEQWLLTQHGVSGTNIAQQTTIPLSGSKGEDFDGWRRNRKAKGARRSKRTGPDLPPPPARLGAVVVATIGPDGARLSGQDGQAMAIGHDTTPAE
jgi:hypothetical protein